MPFSPAFDNALIVATLAHRRQLRKGTRVPYVMHPMHVATLLSRCGFGEPLTTAALLHDVLEDAPFDDKAFEADLRSTFPRYSWPAPDPSRPFRPVAEQFMDTTFGADVMRLVRAVTEEKNEGGPEVPWLARRKRQLEHLAEAGREEAALKAADALHNVSSILRDLAEGRATFTGRFKATPEQSMWYYEQIARLARARAGDGPLVDALDEAVARLRDLVIAEQSR